MSSPTALAALSSSPSLSAPPRTLSLGRSSADAASDVLRQYHALAAGAAAALSLPRRDTSTTHQRLSFAPWRHCPLPHGCAAGQAAARRGAGGGQAEM